MIEKQLTEWLKRQLDETKRRGYVLGVSGGIDSTLMTKLLLDANIHRKIVYADTQLSTHHDDIEYIKSIDMENMIEVDITSIVQSYRDMFVSSGIAVSSPLLVNLQARIRESIFYHLSKINELLVIGTVNKAEFNLGYFVKNSSIGDVLPFADLTKRQIREMARTIGVPEYIASRKASGCNGCEYAEQEWKLSENEVDDFCEHHGLHSPNYELFARMRLINRHKCGYPQIFMPNNQNDEQKN